MPRVQIGFHHRPVRVLRDLGMQTLFQASPEIHEVGIRVVNCFHAIAVREVVGRTAQQSRERTGEWFQVVRHVAEASPDHIGDGALPTGVGF